MPANDDGGATELGGETADFLDHLLDVRVVLGVHIGAVRREMDIGALLGSSKGWAPTHPVTNAISMAAVQTDRVRPKRLDIWGMRSSPCIFLPFSLT